MIKVAMQVGRFPKGVNKGMITLLFKEGKFGELAFHYHFEHGLQDFC
jgi:hypothetical protein